MPGRVNIYCSQERRIQVPQSSDGPRPELYGVVWNLTFLFTYIKVRENFLPIPTYAKNYLQVNRVGKVPLNY